MNEEGGAGSDSAHAPLRILYSFPGTLGRAGIGTTAWHQVNGLIALGHEVRVYSTALEQAAPTGAAEVVTTLTLGRKRIPHRLLGRFRAYQYHDRRVATAIRRLAGELDIVHCWPWATLKSAAAMRAAGGVSVREVPNTHTAFANERVAEEAARLGIPRPKGHSHALDSRTIAFEEREYEAVDLIAVPSEYARQTFLERGHATGRLGLHQYGFNPADFPAPDGMPTKQSGGLRALFVGRCEPRKGLHHALAAWLDSGAADRGSFTICGAFAPGYEQALADHLTHPSVRPIGFVSEVGAAARLMRDSDILILPSVEEGSALVTYEAQASGCVLVVSDAAGARCEHMKGALVHRAGDVQSLTEHLRMLDQDADLLARLRSHTLTQRDRLTWAQGARDLDTLYRGLLHHPA